MSQWHVYQWLKTNNTENLTLMETVKKLKELGFSSYEIQEGIAEFVSVIERE